MKQKILITGGTGTVGSAFIREYKDIATFYVISRNETFVDTFKKEFPDVKSYMCDIRNYEKLVNIFEEVNIF